MIVLGGSAMFFFIGGIQPKKVIVDTQPRACPSCGLPQARTVRVDHYLSIFFLPLLRVKKGTLYLECQSCGSVFSEFGEEVYGGPSKQKICPHCGIPLDSDFAYCPYCGRRVD